MTLRACKSLTVWTVQAAAWRCCFMYGLGDISKPLKPLVHRWTSAGILQRTWIFLHNLRTAQTPVYDVKEVTALRRRGSNRIMKRPSFEEVVTTNGTHGTKSFQIGADNGGSVSFNWRHNALWQRSRWVVRATKAQGTLKTKTGTFKTGSNDLKLSFHVITLVKHKKSKTSALKAVADIKTSDLHQRSARFC